MVLSLHCAYPSPVREMRECGKVRECPGSAPEQKALSVPIASSLCETEKPSSHLPRIDSLLVSISQHTVTPCIPRVNLGEGYWGIVGAI